ncbi:histidine phosphatase family protein [Paenibacillus sp. YN15]|uniref:histidine phosphatase family protein n=1 Tax=Paenibacillus sp. YN15 TaxID=1742774 RepID=UPI000DCB5DD3|nr:histidine phosphatase family protein [Paenibacillus sp. YN15]RAU98607.1 histidine phosphatase family protein [Paenibacillus sp. YN15]
MLLYIIRHGESLGNIRQSLTPNCGLSQLGEAHASRIRDYLEHRPLTTIFSSPLRRVIQTALPLAAVKGVPVQLAPEMCEYFKKDWPAYGTFEWETIQQVIREFPLCTFPERENSHSQWWPTWPETLEQLKDRIHLFYKKQLSPLLSTDAAVAVFGHGASTVSLSRIICPKAVYPPINGNTNGVIYEYLLDDRGICLRNRMITEHIEDCLSHPHNSAT